MSSSPGSPVALGPWQKIVRYKDQVSFYHSQDGLNWNFAEGITLRGLANSIYVGFAVVQRVSVEPCLATGTFQSIQFVQPFAPSFTTSWLGNSLPGGGSHIQQGINAMYLDPGPNLNPLTGQMESAVRLYTNVFWEEDGAEATVYTPEGDFERKLDKTHGAIGGGYAITASASYVYMAMRVTEDFGSGYCPIGWYGVRRYLKDGSLAPWSSGAVCKGWTEETPIGGSIFTISNVGHVRGLAINRRSGSPFIDRLYVSDTEAGKVRIYQDSASTLTWIADVTVARPQAIAIDPTNDTFWVIRADDPATTGTNESAVLHFTASGTPQSNHTISSGANFQVPVALTVATDGKVWVTDDGPSQLVKIFKANGQPANPASFGAVGGIYSNAGGSAPGEVRPTKFNGLTGIGLDFSSPNNKLIYLAGDGHGTGAELRKLLYPLGTQIWEKIGLEFIDAADADPQSDGDDLFTKEAHYEMDYTKPPGEQATYKGMTLDRFTYPNDMRLHPTGAAGVMIRRLGTEAWRVMYVVGQQGGHVGVYRFASGSEIAIPCGLLMSNLKLGKCSTNPFNNCLTDSVCQGGGVCQFPAWPPVPPPTIGTRLVWYDANGDGQMFVGTPPSYLDSEFEEDSPAQTDTFGWYVDDNGDIWAAAHTTQPAIKRYVAQLDANGCPAYDPANAVTYPKPAEFGPPGTNDRAVMRAVYQPSTDTMFLGGYTVLNPKPSDGSEFGMVGTEIIRYDDWQWNHEHSILQEPVWNIPLPYENINPNPPPAEPFYFHAARGMDLAGSLLFVAIGDTAEVRAYDLCDGKVRYKLKPGPEVAGKTGFLDAVVPMNAFQTSNGESLAFTEDVVQAKNMLYRLTIPNQCTSCQCGGFCPLSYCTGMQLGCTRVDTCSYPCGCCRYTCNHYLPGCMGPQTPPQGACPP